MPDYPKIVVPPPGPKARAIVERDERWTSTCYIKEYPLVVARGQGVMVEDVDGNRFLDFMAGIAVSSTGYGHPKVVAAVKDAADRFLHICGSDFYYEGMVELCERLAAHRAGHEQEARVPHQLRHRGRRGCHQARPLRHAPDRDHRLSRRVSRPDHRSREPHVSSKARQHAGFGPLLPDVHHVQYAYRYRCQWCADEAGCNRGCLDVLEQDLFARHLDPHDVAAIFVEPIQGEGGYVVPPPGWLRGPARDLRPLRHPARRRRGAVRVSAARERCGPAITRASSPTSCSPPRGSARACRSARSSRRSRSRTWESGSHGSTFGGNPVCCAAALATLDLVEGGLMANAQAMGDRLQAGMRRLAEKHGCIGDVRGRGPHDRRRVREGPGHAGSRRPRSSSSWCRARSAGACCCSARGRARSAWRRRSWSTSTTSTRRCDDR